MKTAASLTIIRSHEDAASERRILQPKITQPNIAEFIESTNSASCSAEIFNLYIQALSNFGFDRLMYSALRNHPACQTGGPALMRNYSDDWIDHYVRSGYTETDPIRHHCLTARTPFLWSEVAALVGRERARIFDEAAAAGIRGGIGIPLHGPGGEVVGVGLASSLGGADGQAHSSVLHMLSLQFHIAFSALHPATPPLQPVLTEREREILQWCAAGKSNWAIGEILTLSERMVTYHLEQIQRKLGASNKMTAVVKACRLGLIAL